jgi:hypothetical protein
MQAPAAASCDQMPECAQDTPASSVRATRGPLIDMDLSDR